MLRGSERTPRVFSNRCVPARCFVRLVTGPAYHRAAFVRWCASGVVARFLAAAARARRYRFDHDDVVVTYGAGVRRSGSCLGGVDCLR